ncbi:hypothetical protein [Nocardioides sp. CER19]|uniref:hypothetical protein n=1 Tax=Nocardioides sp. CER19 TaxID=3038538 RepID=UPI002446C256|nr:hypothetical protein [Nocardioides sp. CER19]MDH2414062.1 hypothetical protein [Nocardioides sp. CER19]
MTDARLLADGPCELVDPEDGVTTWASVDTWADAWIAEWLHDERGPASTSGSTTRSPSPPGPGSPSSVLAT